MSSGRGLVETELRGNSLAFWGKQGFEPSKLMKMTYVFMAYEFLLKTRSHKLIVKNSGFFYQI
jgi:hypothetical protein